jgi:Holliday junction resolvasome RuvABC endonuclease subunit
VTDHVLGLDPSLTGFGVARYTREQRIDTWVKRTDKLPADAHEVDWSARIAELYRWLFGPDVNLVNTGTVLAVVERPLPPGGGPNTGATLERIWLFGRVIDGFRHRGIPVATVYPSTVKAYIAGNGRADKADVKRAVAALWPGQGLGRIDDNQADAVGAAALGVDFLGWPGPWLDGRRGAKALQAGNWPDRASVRA